MSLTPVYQIEAPAPITRLGKLFLAATNPARKLIGATIEGWCECTANLLFSRDADADHDLYLLNAERLTRVAIKRRLTGEIVETARLQAILREIKAAQAADECEDGFIDAVLCLTRRWSMALEKALKLRKSGAPKRGPRP